MKRDEFFFVQFGLCCDGFSTESEYRIRGGKIKRIEMKVEIDGGKWCVDIIDGNGGNWG
jgi:hypothetical protein